MKAIKFYDKEGTGFELYLDYNKESIIMEIAQEETDHPMLLEFDEQDLDDIILSLVDLKSELQAIRNTMNN